MIRSGCNLSFFFRGQESLERRLPWFGASKTTSSGSRVVQLQHKTVLKINCEPRLPCGIFYARLSSDTTTTSEELDISLLWVPRGHVALARGVLEVTLTECGQLTGFCVLVTVTSLRTFTVNFYPRPGHTREGDRNLNAQTIVLGSIFCLQI